MILNPFYFHPWLEERGRQKQFVDGLQAMSKAQVDAGVAEGTIRAKGRSFSLRTLIP